MDALQHFHQQLQPPNLTDVTGNLDAIHPLFAGFQSKGRDLFIRQMLEGLVKQVLSILLHVAAQPFAEIVQRAQIKTAFTQLAKA